jgi:hypothetical protein
VSVCLCLCLCLCLRLCLCLCAFAKCYIRQDHIIRSSSGSQCVHFESHFKSTLSEFVADEFFHSPWDGLALGWALDSLDELPHILASW